MLTDGVAEYLSRCKTFPRLSIGTTGLSCYLADRFSCTPSGQSFEGGISGSPGVEAHGAYAFCALACLSILGPPEETIPRYAGHPISRQGISSRNSCHTDCV